jgi:hypothetical protein
MDITVIRTTPILEPMAQLNIGADFKLVAPPDGPARGRLDARDPVTGAKKWEINYKEPPLASILATGGNLLFVPDSEGVVHAYNAETGQELWSHSNGMGHNAGIISYMAGGKQYIAVPANGSATTRGIAQRHRWPHPVCERVRLLPPGRRPRGGQGAEARGNQAQRRFHRRAHPQRQARRHAGIRRRLLGRPDHRHPGLHPRPRGRWQLSDATRRSPPT